MPWVYYGSGDKDSKGGDKSKGEAKVGWVDLDGGMPVAGSGAEEHMEWESGDGGSSSSSLSPSPVVESIKASVAASVAKPSPVNAAPVVNSSASPAAASENKGKEKEKEKDVGTEKSSSKEEYVHDKSSAKPSPAGVADSKPSIAAQPSFVDHPSTGGKEATKGNSAGDAKSSPAAAPAAPIGGMDHSIDMMGGDGFEMKASGDSGRLGGVTGAGFEDGF